AIAFEKVLPFRTVEDARAFIGTLEGSDAVLVDSLDRPDVEILEVFVVRSQVRVTWSAKHLLKGAPLEIEERHLDQHEVRAVFVEPIGWLDGDMLKEHAGLNRKIAGLVEDFHHVGMIPENGGRFVNGRVVAQL